MATNRDLLKEAIADAKAVKETAIANAKAALEEAFTPYLKEKLAAKINEMDEAEMEEEMYDEAEMNEMEEEDTMEEISLDELLAELEEEKEPEMEENLSEAKEEEEEEEMAIEDMSEDDLKSFIEDVIKDMVSAGELEAGHEGEEGEEEMEMGGEEMEDGEEEEVDLDEILAEAEEEEVKEELGSDAYASATEVIAGISAILGALGIGAAFNWKDEIKTAAKAGKEALAAKAKEISSKLFGGKKMEEGEKEDLEEAYATIETLQSELNEINLLNAKLLYTNKIFRNKSLTESQKIKVLTAFDKATTKQEAQLIYETLQESLKLSITKSPIKESLGSASKILGNASAKPIIEVDGQFARWQHLAGINKK
jgi:hypothetical protein